MRRGSIRWPSSWTICSAAGGTGSSGQPSGTSGVAGLNVSRRLRVIDAASIGIALGQPLVGQPEQQLLTVGQVGLLDVDAPVGQTRCVDLDRPGALGPAGQQLAADGVAHVVGEQGEAVDAELGHEGRRDVRLQRHGVVPVGLGREAVAQHVEQQHAAPGAQPVEDGGVVERRRGEAVEHQQGRVPLGTDGRRVDGEDALAAQLAVLADRLPAGAGGDRHVPASLPRRARGSPRRRTRSTSTRSRTRPGATRAPRPSRRGCRRGPAGRAGRPRRRCRRPAPSGPPARGRRR